VFNDAIDDEIIQVYPFRKFKIKYEETRKRSLTVEQLREIMNLPCQGLQLMYKDVFMLMFFLIGVNAVDLFNAPKGAISNGRLEYRRAKTGKLYSIKVEPEAMAIINRYSGSAYLINILDRFTSYRFYLCRMNQALKHMVSKDLKFPDISSYWSRHTWATIAAELDIPKETIAAALGHSIGNPTTSIYIKFNQKKVDEANRRVIDYVLYDKR